MAAIHWNINTWNNGRLVEEIITLINPYSMKKDVTPKIHVKTLYILYDFHDYANDSEVL